MKAEQAIALSKAYVEASNAHDLRQVDSMLDEKARYYSSAVGEHQGRAAIRQMMEGFFAAFPDVRWQTSRYRAAGTTGAAFDFVMTATSKATGEAIERRGIERIFFTSDGLISLIEVAVD